ncbi:hypothetical protein CSC94_08955 [Zhengella mangrovi]|uniref:Uncharacterized protein n=1 Tax=Zhengella mangrovi TaxID=1982044 RepID=A0A2G1QQN1_9HYPH|nr:hypothetical protein [Zhengella mangrovi]PHP67795.1 hypothetical protein CSC94_08955 [Zhengella mangrovi]
MEFQSTLDRRGIFGLVLMGILAALLNVPASSNAQDAFGTISPELGALDGMEFRTGIVRVGKGSEAQPLEDKLIFQNGNFISEICRQFNFQPAPYWIRKDGDEVHFLAELVSPTDGKMRWEGALSQGELHGTMHWTKHRWYWTIDVEHTIVGVLDKPVSAKPGRPE